MKNMHLTDRQIQLYMAGETTESLENIQNHLQNCAECSRTLDSYRTIFTLLETEPDFQLQHDFADCVIHKLPAKPASGMKNIRDMAGAVASFLALIAGMLIYFGWSPLKLLTPPDLKPLLQDVITFFNQYHISGSILYLIPCALIAICAVAILDLSLTRNHRKVST